MFILGFLNEGLKSTPQVGTFCAQKCLQCSDEVVRKEEAFSNFKKWFAPSAMSSNKF